MKKSTFFFIFFVISSAFAQEFNFVFEPDSIPVEIEGWQMMQPWAENMS